MEHVDACGCGCDLVVRGISLKRRDGWWSYSTDGYRVGLWNDGHVAIEGSRWSALLTVQSDGVQIQAHGYGDTPEAALDDCHRGRLPMPALRAMASALDALGVRAADPVERTLREPKPEARECEVCGHEAQELGSEARCTEHASE